MNPLSEYREKDEEAKPIARIGSFGLVKFRRKDSETITYPGKCDLESKNSFASNLSSTYGGICTCGREIWRGDCKYCFSEDCKNARISEVQKEIDKVKIFNTDLFGSTIVNKSRKKYVRKGDGERKTVLKEIKDIMDAEAKQQKKPPVNTKLFAIRLSHVPTKDLYFMLSEGRSYRHRTGKPFSKYIMGSVKPRKE